ncbi:hypothetical protein LINGRAHAP2_LOCUS6178 [Linum grandiflorum]
MLLLHSDEYVKPPVDPIICPDVLTDRLDEALKAPEEEWSWQCSASIGRIKPVTRQTDLIVFSFIPRSLNVLADWVARSCRAGSLTLRWIQCLM